MQLKATGYIQPCPLNKTGEKSALNQREVGLGHSVVPPGHGRRHHSGPRHLRTELKALRTGRGSNNGLKTPPALHSVFASDPSVTSLSPLGSHRTSHQDSLRPGKRRQRQPNGVLPPSFPPSASIPPHALPRPGRVQVFRLPPLLHPPEPSAP